MTLLHYYIYYSNPFANFIFPRVFEVQENPQSTGFPQLIEKFRKFSMYSLILNLKSRIQRCSQPCKNKRCQCSRSTKKYRGKKKGTV